MPTREDLARCAMPILRGTAIGSLLGILPGGGALLASFASYTVEKKLSAEPQRFGKGAIEGVAGPESANNAGAQSSFIPMLTLGLDCEPAPLLLGFVLGPMLEEHLRRAMLFSLGDRPSSSRGRSARSCLAWRRWR
jgi:TctA family transporter